MNDRLPRKLAAILYADVAGYSRLTGEDEDTTHRQLSAYLDLISAAVDEHRGRVMHYAGDAVLAMFDAVVDAVAGAVAIQETIGTRNESLSEERKVRFRIGVNLGDVIEDRGDIYGDGVNVAARLESLADPGGVCVSDAVRTAVGTKLSLAFEDMGDQEVKNIANPVRAYRVSVAAGRRPEPAAAPDFTPGPTEKPTIAVLPFTNMSGDPEQEYFADGLTEDVITELSRFHDLLYEEFDRAAYHQRRALELNPNNDLIVVQMGEILTWMGQPAEGIEWIEKAMRLNPYHPERFWSHLARAYFLARRTAEAVEAVKRITAPDATHHAFLAACYAHLGDSVAAGEQARLTLGRARISPWRNTPKTYSTTRTRPTASTTGSAC